MAMTLQSSSLNCKLKQILKLKCSVSKEIIVIILARHGWTIASFSPMTEQQLVSRDMRHDGDVWMK